VAYEEDRHHYFLVSHIVSMNQSFTPPLNMQTRQLPETLIHRSGHSRVQGFIYAFSPIVTGLPSTMAVVTVFPRVLATTRVLPDADGVGVSRSISMKSLLSRISTFIAMVIAPFI